MESNADAPQPVAIKFIRPIRPVAAVSADHDGALRTGYGGRIEQGLVFAVIKAAIDRGGARAFEHLTGAWPGD